MKNILILIILVVFFSGCSKYTMAFDEHDVDLKMLQDTKEKSDKKVLLLSDDEELYIPCMDSATSPCQSLKEHFKTGEVANELAKLYFGQYYRNMESKNIGLFEKNEDRYSLIIYPKIVDYAYSRELVGAGAKMKLNLTVKVQVYSNGKKVVFEKTYNVKGAEGETYYLIFNEFSSLKTILYKSIFEIFAMAKKDMDEALSKDTHESIN